MCDKQTLLTALLLLRKQVASGTQEPLGICGNMIVVRSYDGRALQSIFERWSEFSGVPKYPVPSPKNSPYAAYWDCLPLGLGARREYMWGDNPYGRARRRLLDFTIAELERELAPTTVTSKNYKPTHGGYPSWATTELGNDATCVRVEVAGGRSYIGTDANYEAIKATTPATCCPCGQVPVCHGLRTCGKKSS